MAGLMRAITMMASVPASVDPMTLLSWIGYHTTASVSSRKRLIASPGDHVQPGPQQGAEAGLGVGDEIQPAPELNHPTMIQDAHAVAAVEGRQPVGDDDPGATLQQRVHGPFEHELGCRVEPGRGFVE